MIYAAITQEDAPPIAVMVAARSGIAAPVGMAYAGSGVLSDIVTGYVPLRLDVGLHIERHFYVGIAGQLATIVPKACATGMSCTGSDARIGLMGAYHLRPMRSLDPWLGAGFGFELLHLSRSSADGTADLEARGFELADVELGCDWRGMYGLRLGPVVSATIGQFTSVAVDGVPSRDFTSAMHAWVMLGFRGAYDL